MITRFRITNFKRLGVADIELGRNVVFIGPNNSGKSSALQALTLWDAGWRRWAEKRGGGAPGKRPGVTINRRDLYAIPVPSARLLWLDLHTHETNAKADGGKKTDNIYIVLEAEGVQGDTPWSCALEFYYANEESFYCRLRDNPDGQLPEAVYKHPVVFLPPMSGLADREFRKETGEINVLIGQGQTAQVLRNLCWQLYSRSEATLWPQLVSHIRRLFHIDLLAPEYIPENSSLTLQYRERAGEGVTLDISASGRGCQQVLLLLSFLLANPGAILLLDEPDAHLEILRQRDVYNLLTEVAAAQESQIIAASHSITVMQEAGERDVLVAFLGRPHRVDTRIRQNRVKQALESIPISDYYLAEQMGWVLYLEGSTDLSILRKLAQRLNHKAAQPLEGKVPVIYLGSNKPGDARNSYYALKEAKPDLVACTVLDRLPNEATELLTGVDYNERAWQKREIENYLVTPESLRAFIQAGLRDDDLLEQAEKARRVEILELCVDEISSALRITGQADPWSADIKVTDSFLNPLFKNIYDRLGTPQRTFKSDYHGLADVIPLEQIDLRSSPLWI